MVNVEPETRNTPPEQFLTHLCTAGAPYDVSVIVVSWNTREYLRRCLGAISEHTQDVSYEIIVVDNGSRDGSSQMVRMHFPQVRLIQNPRNVGFAFACNQGLRIARGRYALLLNSDTVVLDGAIDKAVGFADRQPDAGVVGCRILNEDHTVQPSCMIFPDILNLLLPCLFLNKLFPRSRFFGREALTWWSYDEERDVDVIMGCFMLVRRAAIEQVGFLDDRFFVYGEEADWCYRMKQAGWRRVFTPCAQAVHSGGASTRLLPRDMMLQLSGSVLLFLRKHRGRAYYYACCGAMALFLIARILPSLLAAALLPRRRAEMLDRAFACVTGVCRLVLQGAAGLCMTVPTKTPAIPRKADQPSELYQ